MPIKEGDVLFDQVSEKVATDQAALNAELDAETGELGDKAAESQAAVKDAGASKEADPQAAKTEAKEEGKQEKAVKKDDDPKKPLPFDDDPKWKAARAAEKSLNKLLESTGLDSIEALQEALVKGKDIKDLVGDVDTLKEILDKAKTLDRYELHWADQKTAEAEAKLQENESAQETIDRLLQKNADLTKGVKEAKQKGESDVEDTKALNKFNSIVNKAIESASDDLGEEGVRLAEMILEQDSEWLADFDIKDTKSVDKFSKKVIKQLTKTIQGLKQGAVDKYADGKSKINPKPKEKAAADVKAVEKPPPGTKLISSTMDIQDEFNQVGKELTELIMQQVNE